MEKCSFPPLAFKLKEKNNLAYHLLSAALNKEPIANADRRFEALSILECAQSRKM